MSRKDAGYFVFILCCSRAANTWIAKIMERDQSKILPGSFCRISIVTTQDSKAMVSVSAMAVQKSQEHGDPKVAGTTKN
uniref:Uncharacterized protein n=1 Tax=Arundo donax TaxID=35708 RepID=A0A0A9GY84_ARUDO